MAATGFYVVQAGTKLYKVDLSGVATELTLPTGIVIDSTKTLRGAYLNRQVVLANSPSQALWLDAYGTLRPLAIRPPATPPTLTAGGAGSLTGSYLSKYTFFVRDTVSRAIVFESSFSPVSATSPVLASKLLNAAAIEISEQTTVDGRRIYRTTTGPGTAYFKWLDLDGNELTAVEDGVSDATLGLVAAPTDLGTPSGPIELICEWKDRLWAKFTNQIDNAGYSANRKHYAWPATNFLAIRPSGADDIGITAFAPRRDELGIGRLGVLWKVIGDPPDIRLVKVWEGKGPVSADAVIVINDVAYMLFRDGVYTWGSDGVKCITNEDVKPWFITDTYFNRSRFNVSFARYNEVLHAYELHLAAAGSTVEDRWITYHIDEKKWLGPHTMTGFTPASAFELLDSNGVKFPVIGTTNGFLLKMNQTSRSDAGNAIAFDVKLRHSTVPDVPKFWGQMSILSRKESAGTLTVTPAVGELAATDQAAPISVDLTKERQLLRRLSTSAQPLGRVCTLTFTQNVDAQDVSIFGYEIPVAAAGRR